MSPSIQSDIAQLRPESQALIHRMLDQGSDPWAIRRAVQRVTGERVMLQVLTRYFSSYGEVLQREQQARAHADDFVWLVGKKGVKVSELLRAVLIEKLAELKRKKQFTKPDLYKLDDAERKRREFELKQKQSRASTRQKKKELELKERQTQLDEQRYDLDRKKAQATVDQLESKARAGQPLSPDDMRRIREIYGLYDDPEAPETQRQGDEKSGVGNES